VRSREDVACSAAKGPLIPAESDHQFQRKPATLKKPPLSDALDYRMFERCSKPRASPVRFEASPSHCCPKLGDDVKGKARAEAANRDNRGYVGHSTGLQAMGLSSWEAGMPYA
jgi:hypothetical protein